MLLLNISYQQQVFLKTTAGEFIRLRSSIYDGTRRIKSILSCYLPFGNAGGLQLLCCQGFEVKSYDVTLDVLNLNPSDVCNVGVLSPTTSLNFHRLA